MARFKATMESERGNAASKLGHRLMDVDVNGYTAGVKVEARRNAQTDTDFFNVWVSGGSGSDRTGERIAKVYHDGRVECFAHGDQDGGVVIPEPEEGEIPAFGIAPGQYEVAELLRDFSHNPAAIRYIADMMEQ